METPVTTEGMAPVSMQFFVNNWCPEDRACPTFYLYGSIPMPTRSRQARFKTLEEDFISGFSGLARADLVK